MYILDTDHLSFIQRNSREGKQILARLARLDESEVAVTIITYEEQVRGRLSFLSRAKTLEQQLLAYKGLEKLVNDYKFIRILPFNRTAIIEHQRLRKANPRLGKMDLKIAAISLTHDATLLTRNGSDFRPISGLKVEDWSMGGLGDDNQG